MNGRICFIVMVLFFVSSCSHYDRGLEVGPVTGEFLPQLKASGDVAVIGEHINEAKVKYRTGSLGPHKWYVDQNEIVDLAVTVAKDILQQNNVALNEDVQKTLKISFVEASCSGC